MSNRTGGPKLIDVARLADCSPATVSRVLNDNPTVADEIRLRVLQAAATLGYVPNGSARALRSTQTRLIGAVIPTLDHAIYASMVDSLQARLAERHVSLILSTSMYDRDLEFEQVRLLIERGAEALILVGAAHKPETIDLLEQRQLPYVFTYTFDTMRSGVAIGFDNEKAGRTAARFLLDLGHKRLAMIAGITQDNDRAKGRAVGFLDELEKCGFDTDRVPVLEGAYSIHAGYAAMKQLLERNEAPTAVFCGSDILAAGAIKCCNESGIEVPRAVSILGFDNLEIAELTSPELTTLEVPAREMGRLAGDYVTASLAQRRHLQLRELSIRLVVRGSTAVAPAVA
ncbi:LacI family DNA-binding transcriptional regulator [Hyphomicrobiales bacterium]|nr:LacI family DNA-binding transcriptional regulator [Hyphomicrobiales bacterium]CAH1674681.1 LacI family DNA-binding transcriptional regulator [Hyphomicrobiales bacterium]